MPPEGSYDLHDFDPPEHECTRSPEDDCTCELYDRHEHLRKARHERDEARALLTQLFAERQALEERIRTQDQRLEALVKAAIKLVVGLDAKTLIHADVEALRRLLS